jgi:predicted transcriptional regulator
MKNNILISIHPQHVAKILSGEKRFEFRKRVPPDTVRRMVIYATAPVMKVVAIAEINGKLSAKPENIWKRTRHASGITKKFFNDYFQQRDVAHALEIGLVTELDSPLPLSDIRPDLVAPQSYAFLDDLLVNRL